MPLINSPLPRATQPRFYQGSSLRSVRDTERPDRAWIKSKVTSSSVDAVLLELAKIKQDFGRLRRRIVGGGAAPSSGTVDYQGEYDPTKSYNAKVIVRFTPDGGFAGTFISNQAVPAGTSPDTGLPYWSDLNDSASAFWL